MKAGGVTRVAVLSSVPAVLAGLERLLEEDANLEVSSARGSDRKIEAAAVLVVAEEPLWRGLLAESLGGAGARPALVLVTDDEAECRFLASRVAGRGAWAVLPAAVSSEELRNAVHAVAGGLVVVHPSLLAPLMAAGSSEAGESLSPLTDREREVLDLLSKGFSNPEIAGLLGITDHTVKFHTSSVYVKLGVANRTEAVRVGIRAGVISL
jgi:DNA-binding NarL/FixJ family response regulator